MTVREHLQKAHDGMATHHKEMATRHEHLSKCYSAMSKAAPASDSDMYKDIADEHTTIAKAHTAQAEFHSQSADECAKAQEDELGKTLVPSAIRGIYTADVEPTFGSRAIPRPGQPTSPIDKARVPAMFADLVDDMNAF